LEFSQQFELQLFGQSGHLRCADFVKNDLKHEAIVECRYLIGEIAALFSMPGP
jgi:hypothetical protein